MAKKQPTGKLLSKLHHQLKELPNDPNDMDAYMKRLNIEQQIRVVGKRAKNRFFVSAR